MVAAITVPVADMYPPPPPPVATIKEPNSELCPLFGAAAVFASTGPWIVPKPPAPTLIGYVAPAVIVREGFSFRPPAPPPPPFMWSLYPPAYGPPPPPPPPATTSALALVRLGDTHPPFAVRYERLNL